MEGNFTVSGDLWNWSSIKKEAKPFVPKIPSDPSIWICLKKWMDPLACGNTFAFDPLGDLTLKVGDSENTESHVYSLAVCSRSLARCSDVFRVMLFAGFAESRPKDTNPWTIDMPEEKISPLFLVLSIVHGHFQHIPKNLDQHDLYELLVVTEKYDMTKILKPWAHTWFKPYISKEDISVKGEDVVMRISWELGHEKTFRSHAMNLLRKSSINKKGDLIGSDGLALNNSMFLEPPGILDSIAQTRKAAILDILGVFYDAIRNALEREECSVSTKNYYSDCRMSSKECASLTLGSLIRSVHQISLEDVALLRTSTPHDSRSINELSSNIQKMKFGIHGHQHSGCNPLEDIKQKVRNIVENLECPVTDNHLKYLRQQAKKTGV